MMSAMAEPRNFLPQILQKLTQMPLLLGVEGEVVEVVKGLLPLAKSYLQFEEFQQSYRGITIEGRRFPKNHRFIDQFNSPDAEEVYQPVFYYAEFGPGIYFSFRKEMIKDLIDRHKDQKSVQAIKGPEVNAAVRLNPRAAPDTREASANILNGRLIDGP